MTGYVRINTRPIPLPTTAEAGEREPDVASGSTRNVGRKPAPAASGANREHDVEVSRGR
jgi:hypothetical protein